MRVAVACEALGFPGRPFAAYAVVPVPGTEICMQTGSHLVQ